MVRYREVKYSFQLKWVFGEWSICFLLLSIALTLGFCVYWFYGSVVVYMGVLFANLQLLCFNYLKLSSLDHPRELFLLSLYTHNFHSPSYLRAKNIEFLNEWYLSFLNLCALISVRTGEQWSFTIYHNWILFVSHTFLKIWWKHWTFLEKCTWAQTHTFLHRISGGFCSWNLSINPNTCRFFELQPKNSCLK